ncbi:MAG: hypothetical protein P8L46_10190 [Acidimicrobiales bacterium]|nr:hypothetical protein [Acidimicrobiales bacterium]MDG2218400.1 hypothetical protein [Acidimicrobiales bacterium]
MNSLNIFGAGPSGSTLLGLMAGSHSACVYLGEAARIESFDKADWPEQKRACQICGPACAICQLLERAYEPAMLRFQHGDHHRLGGNLGTHYQVARAKVADPINPYLKPSPWGREHYERHDAAVRLDLRRKHELDPAHQALFQRIVGSFNAPMAWED